MITDAEFVAIKAFDRTIDQRDGEIARANGIIRQKNALLSQATARINAQAERIRNLEAALIAERKKSSGLAGQLTAALTQLQRFADRK